MFCVQYDPTTGLIGATVMTNDENVPDCPNQLVFPEPVDINNMQVDVNTLKLIPIPQPTNLMADWFDEN